MCSSSRLAFYHEGQEEYEEKTRRAGNGLIVFALLFFVPCLIFVVKKPGDIIGFE